VFVIEEPVLRFRPYGTAVQRDQLQHLLDMMMLPSVSFGIIPMGTDRRGHRPRESFDITDSDLVTIEMLSGFLSLTHPDEIGAYVTAWEHLFSIAVRGKAARALVKMRWPLLARATGAGEAHGWSPQPLGGPSCPISSAAIPSPTQANARRCSLTRKRETSCPRVRPSPTLRSSPP